MITIENANSQQGSSPSLVAGIGIELEISSIQIEPYLPKHTVLLFGTGWRLEADVMPNEKKAHLEFVLDPMYDLAEIGKAVDEILSLLYRIRDQASSRPEQSIYLSEVSDGCAVFCKLIVKRRDFICRMQPTYGVGLKDIAKFVDLHCLPETAEVIHKATKRVEDFYFERRGVPLSTAVGGLVELINIYLNYARGNVNRKVFGRVKVNFHLLSRSDFCSIYDHLLDNKEREQAKFLLLAEPGKHLPGLMEALAIPSASLVFRGAYFDQDFKREEAGPTVAAWLASIVHGRDEGELRKDLMSPPPGLRLHCGNLKKDFSMGAMGVDRVNQLLLFEIRWSRICETRDFSVHSLIKNAIATDYEDARSFNELLKPQFDMIQKWKEQWSQYRVFDLAVHLLGEVPNALEKCITNNSARVLKGTLLDLNHTRSLLDEIIAVIRKSDDYQGPCARILLVHLDQIGVMLGYWARALEIYKGPNELVPLLRKCEHAVGNYVDELWKILRKGVPADWG